MQCPDKVEDSLTMVAVWVLQRLILLAVGKIHLRDLECWANLFVELL